MRAQPRPGCPGRIRAPVARSRTPSWPAVRAASRRAVRCPRPRGRPAVPGSPPARVGGWRPAWSRSRWVLRQVRAGCQAECTDATDRLPDANWLAVRPAHGRLARPEADGQEHVRAARVTPLAAEAVLERVIHAVAVVLAGRGLLRVVLAVGLVGEHHIDRHVQ